MLATHYQTSEIARLIGLHPNTIRLYEQIGYITPARRQANGYRVFGELHVLQLHLVRYALQAEILHNGLRQSAIAIITAAANKDFQSAIAENQHYLAKLQQEQMQAEEALRLAASLLQPSVPEQVDIGDKWTRRQAAVLAAISPDTLRNWERNGLLTLPQGQMRRQYGYRSADIRRLKIIRALRTANYSIAAILRMLLQLERNPHEDIRQAIDTVHQNDEVISVCDHLLTALQQTVVCCEDMQLLLLEMERRFSPNPPL